MQKSINLRLILLITISSIFVSILQAAEDTYIRDYSNWCYSAERAIFELINEVRVNNSRKPLLWSPDLAEVSRYHSGDMAIRGYFSHETPEGTTVSDRITRAGIPFQTYCENIYMWGIDTSDVSVEEFARKAVEWWWNSKGHQENLLTTLCSEGGVGVYYSNDGVFVTYNGLLRASTVPYRGGCLF